MHKSGMAAALAVGLLSVTPVFAQSPSGDASFAMQAAQGGLAEVMTARLALKKSSNATVLAFARRMIADHTPNNAKLAAIMKAEGMSVPVTVDAKSAAMMRKLQSLSGAAFNSAYLSDEAKDHTLMQMLLQSEINGGKDTRLVAYAKATLPAVNQHLAMAQADARMLHGGSMGSMGSMHGAMGGAMGHGTMGSGSGANASGMGSGTGSGTNSGTTNTNSTSTTTTNSPQSTMSSPMPQPT